MDWKRLLSRDIGNERDLMTLIIACFLMMQRLVITGIFRAMGNREKANGQ